MRTRTRADGDEGSEEISLSVLVQPSALLFCSPAEGGGVSPPSPLLHTGRPSEQTPSSPCHWPVFGTQKSSPSLSLAKTGGKPPRLARWRGDITWTALHRVGEVRLAEQRSPPSLQADWSRAAAWLLPELRLLPKDRLSHRKLSNMFLQGLRPPLTSARAR